MQQFADAGIASSAAFGIAIFAILIVLHNNLMLSRHFIQVEKDLHKIHIAYDQLSDLLLVPNSNSNSVKTPVASGEPVASIKPPQSASILSSFTDKPVQTDPSIKPSVPPDLKLASDNSNSPAVDEKSKTTNVVQLKNSPNTAKSAENGFRPKPSQLKKALNDGGVELYLQPVLEIPAKSIRYFEALALSLIHI